MKRLLLPKTKSLLMQNCQKYILSFLVIYISNNNLKLRLLKPYFLTTFTKHLAFSNLPFSFSNYWNHHFFKKPILKKLYQTHPKSYLNRKVTSAHQFKWRECSSGRKITISIANPLVYLMYWESHLKPSTYPFLV